MKCAQNAGWDMSAVGGERARGVLCALSDAERRAHARVQVLHTAAVRVVCKPGHLAASALSC